MGHVREKIDVPQPASQVEALWYATERWPTFIDGFAHVVRQDPDWPRSGELVWDSTPGGRGRVRESVVRYDPRAEHVSQIEDEQVRGTQTVRFTPHTDGCTITMELDYVLKRDHPGVAVFDVLFVRRPMKDLLRRTLSRFRRELRDEVRPPV